jgi:hypothetical protein
MEIGLLGFCFNPKPSAHLLPNLERAALKCVQDIVTQEYVVVRSETSVYAYAVCMESSIGRQWDSYD